ncbi:efflux RND transporter permease subunit [Rhodopila globiformis]|uniref:Multidrug transporter subunit MdtC n=1 Tax=Rhodopila globiformis TaxID=1071 RepID=A0A2S6NK04_RHOGL|nr:efflux RND transporter permease subunit [Rhodopila globiformis]PPQ35271.1 multidrug transporter subunit MdtC [Rhodopila globiformis]
MNPSKLFIERPVATTLLMVAMLLVGLLALGFLPVSALPDVDYPTIEVQTFYPGASPEVMTDAVTAPLERQFGQMPGLAQMASTSGAGASVITLQFTLSLKLDVAEQEVQAAINAAGNLLPADLPAPPIYAKVNPADAPIMTIALTSATLPLARVHDLAEQLVALKLSELPGIGMVGMGGGGRPALRVRFRPAALAALGINIDDLRTTIGNLNVNLPKGGFDGRARSYALNANDQMLDAHSLQNQVIAWRDGAPVRLSDVATVAEGVENTAQAAWVNRVPAVILNIQRQPGANVIAAVAAIRAKLPELRASLPASVSLAVVSDRTVTIHASIRDAARELLFAIALVVLVIMLFLRTVPATLIPSLSVPLSLVGTLAVMYLWNFSIDNLSLMALTIATGFVIDDAIVVIENIARHIEAGATPRDAALAGSRQIGFTVISLTVSLIAVLIPLLFMADVVGRLFHEFALTLAVSIVLSAVVALTLVPMLCARLLRPRARAQRTHAAPAVYAHALDWVLDHQRLMLAAMVLTLGLTGLLYVRVPKGFFPTQDTGMLQAVTRAPAGIGFKAMGERQQRLAAALLGDPAVDSLTSVIGVDGSNPSLNQGRMGIVLRTDRQGTAAAIMRRLQAEAASVDGIELQLRPTQDLTVDASTGATRYHFLLSAPRLRDLAAWLPRFLAQLRAQPALADVSADLHQDGRELRVAIDRDTAARFGITPASVDNALYDSFGQRIVSTIFTPTDQYRVIMEADPATTGAAAPLDDIYLPSALVAGGQVPLRALAAITPRPAPLAIDHLAQFPATTVSFNLAPGASLDAALQAIHAAARAAAQPRQIRLVLQGEARALTASLANNLLLILAAVGTMYIVLGVLYENFIHPLTILSTLPAAAVGALLALLISGHELDIIAIVLLIGIVKKNAILMIDFALDAQRNRGLSPRAAIREAALQRFRPILMTTCAALFAALPLMFAHGQGAELRQPLGLAIVGGLLVSQVLTVLTTPVVYLFFDRLAGVSGRRPIPL